MIQDLSNRAIFRVTGNDAIRYINGQVSQDVNLASENTAVYSVVASFKGKMQGDLYLRLYKGELLIDTSEEQRESLLMRLDKYLIADDAEIEDVTGTFHLVHTIEKSRVDSALASWDCNRYGVPGEDHLYLKSDKLPLATEKFDWDSLRISHKIALWGNELTEDTLPPEASLEDRAVSYTKGCYTGQEVISRIKSAGKTNRHLVGFKFDHNIATPLNLYIDKSAEGKPGATITSASINDSGNRIGLGYRTRKHQDTEVFYDSEGNAYTIS